MRCSRSRFAPPLSLLAAASLPFAAMTARGQATVMLVDDVIQPGTVVSIGAGESGSINPAGDPFAFANAASLLNIQSIAITLTLIDGDTGTGPDDVFRDTLTLRLDGIETGLVLNGFSSAANEGNIQASDYIRLRLEITNPANAGAILAALQVDNQLVGSLYESAGVPGANSIGLPAREFGSSTPTITAVLEITGIAVPEPGTWTLLSVGAIVLCGGVARSRRRQAAAAR